MVDVFVVAPIRLHRESLCVALSEVGTLTVAGGAATLTEALPRLRELRPQVAVVDASTSPNLDVPLPPTAEHDDVKLLAVGVPDEEAVAWIEAGASGYVPLDGSLDDLASAVASVARGELLTSGQATTHILDRVRRVTAEVPDAAEKGHLTPRETEVADLVADGLPNKLIAQRLSIKEQTVKNHMRKILRKLGVTGRGEAAARVRRGRRSDQ